MQLRELRLTGPQKESAIIRFAAGGNVISGASDTGKSYILRCIDFVLGAEEMTKKIDEDEGYELIFVEFCNSDDKKLTLVRHLSGGDVGVHYCSIDAIEGEGTKVVARRQGKSTAQDVTSVFMPFAGMDEARLRASKIGDTQRLTVRTLIPAFLVAETTIISEMSPVFGNSGYDKTPRKRMLSYLLTGQDDHGIISAERVELARAEARAKLTLVSDLLKPIEARRQAGQPLKHGEENAVIDRADEGINRLSSSLAENTQERAQLQKDRSDAVIAMQNAEGQIAALDELLTRYELLNKRYGSDLKRLDFVAEGSHFLDALQEVRCPLCDQPMNEEHRHNMDGHVTVKRVYRSAQAEAAKILGLQSELAEAISSLKRRRATREEELVVAELRQKEIDQRINRQLAPALQATKLQLDQLIKRRVELEHIKSDSEQVDALLAVRAALEDALAKPGPSAKEWANLDAVALHKFCLEIETVLKEWSWNGQTRVEFDDSKFDIKVDGKTRQSHGKGVRAVLHAAFLVALLRFCVANQNPHPGFVILDSPLTTFKQGRDEPENAIDPSIEAGFWKSLSALSSDLQIIVLDNKEPPASVVSAITYTWFAGTRGKEGERRGFIPNSPKPDQAVV